jgi:hypothetical protein
MKLIKPISIWKNGESQEANLLIAFIENDNLTSSCSFHYLLNEGGQGTEESPLVIGKTLAEGKIKMDGENYLAWDGNNNSAFEYIAKKLNLTLI